MKVITKPGTFKEDGERRTVASPSISEAPYSNASQNPRAFESLQRAKPLFSVSTSSVLTSWLDCSVVFICCLSILIYFYFPCSHFTTLWSTDSFCVVAYTMATERVGVVGRAGGGGGGVCLVTTRSLLCSSVTTDYIFLWDAFAHHYFLWELFFSVCLFFLLHSSFKTDWGQEERWDFKGLHFILALLEYVSAGLFWSIVVCVSFFI